MVSTVFVLNPMITFIIFMVLISIAIVFAIQYKKSDVYFRDSNLNIFISILMGIGVLITLLLYYALVNSTLRQNDFLIIDDVNNFYTKSYETLPLAMTTVAKSIPHFVASLTPLSPQIDTPLDPQTVEFENQKRTLSLLIFDTWRGFFNLKSFDMIQVNPWICYQLQFCHSIELYNYWKFLKINYGPHTNSLGDLLFEYGLNIEPTSEAYQTATTQLSQDPKFLLLIK